MRSSRLKAASKKSPQEKKHSRTIMRNSMLVGAAHKAEVVDVTAHVHVLWPLPGAMGIQPKLAIEELHFYVIQLMVYFVIIQYKRSKIM